jgi:crotonobetainyl-CoA:carnitine CoA-transferase CaiB-like acyl-CoA transferase
MKKSNLIEAEAQKALAIYQEKQAEKALAEAEEKATLEKTKEEIDRVCSENGLKCGIILTHDDALAILQIMLRTNETVEVAYRLYPTDIEPETPQIEKET